MGWRRYAGSGLAMILASALTWVGLAAFAPDATYALRDGGARAVMRAAQPTSYADAVARFDTLQDEPSTEAWPRFGDQVRLMVGNCYGECPLIEVIVLRAPRGDDVVLSRVIPWDLDPRDGDTPYTQSCLFGAYDAATRILRSAKFDTVPPTDRLGIDAVHLHLSHTLHGQTHDVVTTDLFLRPADPADAARFDRGRGEHARLTEAAGSILRLAPWTMQERAALGRWVD